MDVDPCRAGQRAHWHTAKRAKPLMSHVTCWAVAAALKTGELQKYQSMRRATKRAFQLTCWLPLSLILKTEGHVLLLLPFVDVELE